MTNCIIHAIPVVEMEMHKASLIFRLGHGQIIHPIAYVWYIEGPKEKILVDAGVDIGFLKDVRKQAGKQIQTLESGLDKFGLSFGDIDLVILTHLHFDHVAEARRFPRARFLVQKSELEFASNPHPIFASGFSKESYNGLDFEVISGDARVCDGVSVLSTPGHTPGTQSVSVNTAKGAAIICGLCAIRENFEPHPSLNMAAIPSGTPVDPILNYDSLLRVKKMADIVVPIHDREFLQKTTVP